MRETPSGEILGCERQRRRLNQDPTPRRDSELTRDPWIPTPMRPKDRSSSEHRLLPYFRGDHECERHRCLLFLRQNPGKGGTQRLRPKPKRTEHRCEWEGAASTTEQDAAAKTGALYILQIPSTVRRWGDPIPDIQWGIQWGTLQCSAGSQPSNHEYDDFDERNICVAMVKNMLVQHHFIIVSYVTHYS